MSTPHERFQVCDDICGHIDAVSKKALAVEIAKNHLYRYHSRTDFEVCVFDRMSRKDKDPIVFKTTLEDIF